MTTVRIGTRASRLALAQAQLAADRLRLQGHAVVVVPLSTRGDSDRSRSFAELGERGVFAGEIEQALIDETIDVAVHSAKDLTDDEPERLVTAACLERADPRDAWCGIATRLDDVPRAARCATASLRRGSQLRHLRPDLQIESLRGNVDTRLRKLRERRLDGIILAACGLDRLGISDEIGFRFSIDDVIPESGQGIIALQVRRGEEHLVAALDDPVASLALRAERACTRRLAGGCTVPVAAYAELTADNRWRVRGYVGAPDGSTALIETAVGEDPIRLAVGIAEALLRRGGAAIVERAR